ncbi:hypothetical protein HP439_15235 [Sphingobacterium shayense]|uniref:hypothetical protein n=1 Tax=Sphingobacterium shayense TaxID=626343 RepID=UPI001551A606|nr:hypothetical protein [Sphingobacterium shayense]NQD72078.1 hypothetical protein [Sphingobacterium shayense]
MSLSFSSLYRQALANPSELSLEDLELLISKYPFSQPLYFARERRQYIMQGTVGELTAQAKLLASSPNWLFEYLQLPVEHVPILEVLDDDYVPFEDVEPLEEEGLEFNEVESEEFIHEQEIDNEDVSSGDNMESAHDSKGETPIPQFKFENFEHRSLPDQHPEEELNTLVNEGIGGGDFFALHVDPVDGEREQIQHSQDDLANKTDKKKEEDISLYNDELMPYSFRWWLHKTRLEFAETYQPFASPNLPVRNKPAFDASELDRVILDQQIRENIIHLQDPEDKLSDSIKQRATTDRSDDRTTEVIERFIREEPQIQPPPAEQLNTENKARKSSEEQFDLVTETLAAIYTDQSMFVKAIEVYKKLIVRFPEKKSYFATQIKELEEKLY